MPPARVLVTLALALVSGCASSPALPSSAGPADAPAPSAEAPIGGNRARVESVREIGPYLEAHLRGGGGQRGFLFPASDPCRRALADGAQVRLSPAKPLVQVTGDGGGTPCGALGLAGLAAWRDALPPRRASFLIVTEPAELRLVAEPAGLLIAAGALPLVAELRWSRPLDVAAVLPDTPACRAQLARGRTEMEFRPRGEDVFVLRGQLEACPILAIAEPVFLD